MKSSDDIQYDFIPIEYISEEYELNFDTSLMEYQYNSAKFRQLKKQKPEMFEEFPVFDIEAQALGTQDFSKEFKNSFIPNIVKD